MYASKVAFHLGLRCFLGAVVEVWHEIGFAHAGISLLVVFVTGPFAACCDASAGPAPDGLLSDGTTRVE